MPELVLLSGDEARKLEPNLSDEVVEALFAPTGGIVCPFGLTIALAENAADNGVCFYRETEVTHMKKQKEGYKISTNKGEITAKCVVNAAGVYADEIHNICLLYTSVTKWSQTVKFCYRIKADS